jgi:phenylacetate-coenzyme A ligase PaaK-like adenylate-forming protein
MTSDRWTPIDKALFKPKTLFNVPQAEAEKLRFNAIKYAFRHHYDNCAYYHNFCKKMEVKPDDICSQSDFIKIPLISDLNFKSYLNKSDFYNWLNKIFVGDLPEVNIKKRNPSFDDVIKAVQEKGITVTYSSGTRGKFSFTPRDELSWKRQQYAYARSFELMPFIQFPYKYTGVLFMPNPKKTHLFFARIAVTALEAFDMMDESRVNFAIDREFTTKFVKIFLGTAAGVKERLWGILLQILMVVAENKIMNHFIRVLEKCEKEKENVLIGGQPFLINALLSRIEKDRKTFDLENSIVLTTGGWKVHKDNKITEHDFRQKIGKILGIPDNRCRDLYGMVECSTLNVSCEGHYKHIPHSVIYPMVLDEEYEPVGFGEYGRFAFLDPLANSYPGFITTGDKVKLLEQCPVCDRPGPVVDKNISRMTDVEAKGCGEIMARMFSKEIDK